MSTLHDHDKHLISVNEFRSFMFQGRANFTLVNMETDNHITFYVKSKKVPKNAPEETRLFDISVKAIGDGLAGKVYLGHIDRTKALFWKHGGVSPDHVGVKTVSWLLQNWRRLEKFDGVKLKIYHHNICCKCGRELTVEESIQDGIGPECVKTRMKQSLKMMEELGLVFKEGENYTTPANYDSAISFGVGKFPHYLDKFYIPARLRKKDEFIKELYELDKYGLW